MWNPQSIYTDFLLCQPTLFFGEDAIWGLANFPGAKIAIVHGRTINYQTKELMLTVFKKKAVFFIERSWDGEPDMVKIKETITRMEEIKPDVILAIGGGSVIDGTKLCRLFYEFPYYRIGETRIGQMAFKTQFIAIPTTIGSGAEASSAAVYTNVEKGCKEMIVSHSLQPSVVILNSQYVEGGAYRLKTASVLDALGHVVEGYVSARTNSLSDINAEMALRIIYHEADKIKEAKCDYLRLQYAGYLGGIVQNHCIVGAAHAIAHQLATRNFPHGEAVALLLSPVILLNSENENSKNRYENLCRKSGVESLNCLFQFIERMLIASTIIERKNELKQLLMNLYKEETFVSNVIEDLGGKGNPVAITREYLGKLIGEYL